MNDNMNRLTNDQGLEVIDFQYQKSVQWKKKQLKIFQCTFKDLVCFVGQRRIWTADFQELQKATVSESDDDLQFFFTKN